MKKCSYCGRENSDDVNCCQECKTDFAETNSPSSDDLGSVNGVTIFTTFNSAESGLVRSRLDVAGFHPFVANENAASYMMGYSTATLIKVQVPESEADDAKEFLAAPGSPAE